MVNGGEIRRVLLETVRERASDLEARPVLKEAAVRLKDTPHLAILTAFGDLFRTGHLAWGCDIHNPGPPWMHVTEQGRRALANLSRDPLNPGGYLAHLDQVAQITPIARAYIEEALKTWAADCFKASAVMVGAASERLILDVRDALLIRMQALGLTISADLKAWQISRVLRAIIGQLNPRRDAMPGELRERYDGFWTALTTQIRIARNDAGHPSSIDPVTQETVHASLLIFPELAGLATGLVDWIGTDFS
jgi:hypothetical protein